MPPSEIGGLTACAPERGPSRPTKKRAVELVALGLKVYEYMTEIGIKQEECCHFGNVMQTLLRLPD